MRSRHVRTVLRYVLLFYGTGQIRDCAQHSVKLLSIADVGDMLSKNLLLKYLDTFLVHCRKLCSQEHYFNRFSASFVRARKFSAM